MEENQKTHTIEVSQDFSVPVEELFQAWTEAEHLKQWWHPMGDSLESVTNELQTDGAVEYQFNKNEFRVSGKYKEAEINKKLVYTWNWDFDKDDLLNETYTLSISFESNDGGSSIHVVQEGLESEEAAPADEGAWKTELENLKKYLEKSANSAKENLKTDEGQSDRSGGYNEAPEQVKVGGADVI